MCAEPWRGCWRDNRPACLDQESWAEYCFHARVMAIPTLASRSAQRAPNIMAGKNVVQKILARASGKQSVETGDYVIVTSNCITTFGGDGDARGLNQLD